MEKMIPNKKKTITLPALGSTSFFYPHDQHCSSELGREYHRCDDQGDSSPLPADHIPLEERFKDNNDIIKKSITVNIAGGSVRQLTLES